jgi:hypothetical protein
MLQAEHLDEGTLHAFIDGELDSDQLAEVERHLADCAECRQHADEAQGVLAEADDLIERLDPPPFVMLPEGRSMGTGNRLEPVVLIPPEPETPRPGMGRPYRPAQPKLKRPKRPFAPPRAGRRALMAAGLAALLGVGYLLTRDGDEAARDVQLARTETPSAPTMSGFERGTGAAPEAAAALPSAESSAGAGDDGAANEVDTLAGNEAGDEAGEAGAAAGAAAVEEPQQLAARAAAEPAAPRREPAPPPRPTPTAAQTAAARQAAAERAAREAERDVAARTQEILEETAQEAAPPAARAAAPAPDPVSALERRAGVYSRIGLDEARRMLGSPAHAILDLRPQFIGLAPSSGVPGADPGRPLVRVVYLDPSQRLIMLDQQRQSGELPPSTGNMIVLGRGGVRLWLHGGVPAATLRELAERVR